MHLTPQERDKLLIFTAGELAKDKPAPVILFEQCMRHRDERRHEEIAPRSVAVHVVPVTDQGSTEAEPATLCSLSLGGAWARMPGP